MTTRLLAAALLLALFFAPPARADEREECAASYERAQRARQRAELVTAHAAALRCARSSCPGLLRDECGTWVDEIRRAQPRLVVRVRDADGCPRDDASIDVGGPAERDAEAFVIDPGRHAITVRDPRSSRSRSLAIDFTPGERRDIDVDFTRPGAVCRRRTFSPMTVALGASGGGLVLVGATLGILGVVKRGGLDDCKPGCSEDRLGGVRPFFVAGDVVAGVGLLLLGAAAVTHFSGPREIARWLRPLAF